MPTLCSGNRSNIYILFPKTNLNIKYDASLFPRLPDRRGAIWGRCWQFPSIWFFIHTSCLSMNAIHQARQIHPISNSSNSHMRSKAFHGRHLIKKRILQLVVELVSSLYLINDTQVACCAFIYFVFLDDQLVLRSVSHYLDN